MLLGIGGRAIDWVTDAMERYPRTVMAAFTFLLLACGSLLGATKLFWYDEFLTYYPARMSVPDLLSFYRDALDTQTPTQALAMKAAMSLFGATHWAARVPSILAFALSCVCLYLFVERRLPRTYALAAMLFPAATITIYFATEARPYAFLLGFSTLAMLAWQRASEENRHWGWVALLGFSLAACVVSHYYAVLLWIPLGLAELARWRERGRPDVALWLVCLAALSPILIFLPTIRTVSHTYGGAILSSRLSSTRFQYTILLVRNLIPFPLLMAVILLCLLARWATPAGKSIGNFRLSEWVLLIAVAALVVFEIPLAIALGQYGERYVVETVAGVGIVLVAVLHWLARGDKRFGAALTLLFLGYFLLKTASGAKANWAESGGMPLRAAQPFRNFRWMAELERTSLPFVTTPGELFMQLQFYAPPELQPRIIYPFSDYEVRHSGHPQNADKYFELWVPRIPIRAVPYESVVTPGSHFLYCLDTSGFSWQLYKLLKQGATLKLLSQEGQYQLYDVQL